MAPFDTPPTPVVDRGAPVARGLWCWPALLPAAALALDAAWPLPEVRPGVGVTALDVAALVCLAWATLGRGRAHWHGWGTPAVISVIRRSVLRKR